MSASAKLQAYMREMERPHSQSHQVHPFTLFLHTGDKGERSNYAMPYLPVTGDMVAGDIGEALHQLERICEEHECKAHIRFLRAFSPQLLAALQACGYDVVESWPLLVCMEKDLRSVPPVAGLEMVTVTHESSLEELKENLDTNTLGFDVMAPLTTDEEAEAFRPTLVGGLAFTARIHGQAAAAGMVSPIRVGITELLGVTTLPAFRRRGIAAYLSVAATAAAFALGAETIFLIPENAEALRVYERIGYRFYSDLLLVFRGVTPPI